MDAHALHVLEFRAVLDKIAGLTHSEPGSAWVKAKKPRVRLRSITRDHTVLNDMRSMFEHGSHFPSLHFADPLPVFNRVRPKGALLDGDELLLLRDFLRACRDLKTFLASDPCRECPGVGKLGYQVSLPANLLPRLEKTLDRDGHLVDTASPRLAALRRSVRKLEASNQRLLERLLKDDTLTDIYQERFVTLRNGRYVLPVRREAKNRLPGVIHDLSDSGRTVFMEPESSVEIGNELSATRLEERDECRRIFAELSQCVRDGLPELEKSLQAAAHLDGLFAVTRWSSACGGILPRFSGRTRLVNVRHPLLDWQFREEQRPEELVPLSLSLPKDTRTLIITGSNSGGKTVALKTLGLIALVAQAGLPIPASEDTELEVFDRVFADIGDEQSLAENLSTFTGHLTRMKTILGALDPGRALILLDELGTGTDPLEGGALGCALLAEFVEMNALTVATTHLGAIKSYAQEQPGMLNGAVRFNLNTLAPEYVLEVGRPGASHALRIAERVGIPRPVLDRAEKMLDSDHLRMENMLVELEDRERQTEKEERQAREALEKVRNDRRQLEKELADLNRKRKQLMNEAYQEAEAVVNDTRRQMEHIVSSLHEQGEAEDAQKRTARREARNLLCKTEKKLAQAQEQTRESPRRPLRVEDLQKGQPVNVLSLQAEGVIRSVSRNGKRVAVDVKGMEFTVAVDNLERVDKPKVSTPEKKNAAGGISVPKIQGAARSEILLLGKRVDEACEELDRFIDRARRSHLAEIRIVHGFGTGRLMKGIHAWLGENGFAKRFRLADADKKEPGGGGVTIVEL